MKPSKDKPYFGMLPPKGSDLGKIFAEFEAARKEGREPITDNRKLPPRTK